MAGCLFMLRGGRPPAPRAAGAGRAPRRPPRSSSRTPASGRTQATVAALVVGEPPDHAGLDRTAPTTLDHRGGVAGAEAEAAHGGHACQV
jgi:hypothetical protein